MAMDIGKWWQSILTANELRKIRASQAVQMKALEFAKQKWGQVFPLVGGQIGAGGEGGRLPTEYSELINLFQPGGQYGAGGRAEARRGAREALASGQVGLTATGMSSGTNVAGLRARAAADEAIARKKIEDERIRLLGGAYGTAGGARLQVRGQDIARQAQLLQTLSGLA